MTVIAPRSSATARVSRNARSGVGSADPITARSASANAMSVAIGTAQPAVAARPATARYSPAGTTIPASAAAIGSTAWLGVRSCPTTSYRLSSRPATRKKTASSPSAAQCSTVSGPRCAVRTWSYAARQGLFAHAIATTVAASTSAPPTVSSRNASATNRRSGSGSRARRCRGDMRLPGSARSSADQTSRRAAVSVAAEANRLAEEVADAELEDEVAQPQVGPGQGDGDRRHDQPGPGELPEADRDAVAGGEARDDDVRAGPDRRRVAAEVRAER